MMKLALSAWSCHQYLFEGIWSNADFIDFAATVEGVRGVELLTVLWNEEKDIAAVREALARTGLALACFDACNDFVRPDERERQEQLQDVRRAVDMAVLLGAGVVRVFAGDRKEGISFEQAKDWIVEGLKQGAAYAAAKGIVLCLENHGVFAGRGDQVAELIAEVGSPALRSTFDMGNFLLVDELPVDAFALLSGQIGHVHAKDFRKAEPEQTEGVLSSLTGVRYVGVVPTEGEVPAELIVRKLADSGYDGWLSVEYEGLEEQRIGAERAARQIGKLIEG